LCLPSAEPLLCEVEEKPQREVANTSEQLRYIESLVSGGVRQLRESHVLEFHGLAVEGIFSCGGQYRTVTRTARLDGAEHVLPEPALIRGHVCDTTDRINSVLGAIRREASASRSNSTRSLAELDSVVDAAAYALWRFNWIHPFAGGNGRTARAITYLILCIDYGAMIPGTPSLPTIISRRRREYEEALHAADAGERAGRERLQKMRMLVGNAIVEQLARALARAQKKKKKR